MKSTKSESLTLNFIPTTLVRDIYRKFNVLGRDKYDKNKII